MMNLPYKKSLTRAISVLVVGEKMADCYLVILGNGTGNSSKDKFAENIANKSDDESSNQMHHWVALLRIMMLNDTSSHCLLLTCAAGMCALPQGVLLEEDALNDVLKISKSIGVSQ